jgi:NitT/TauT family transport system substrate-binding protein
MVATMVALLVALVSACTPAAPASPPTLSPASPAVATKASPAALSKIVTSWNSASGDQVPLWVAKEAGYFNQAGIDADVQYIASTTSMAALLSGQTQFAHIGGSEVLSAVAGGADLVVLAVPGPVYPYALYVSADIRSAADLKGKKLGVSGPGSSSDTALRVALPKLNITPDKDVDIVSVGSTTNLTASLLSGAIVGGMSHPPDTLVLEPKGFHPIYDLAQQKLPFANNTIATQRAFVDSHRELTQGYVDAVVRAIAREKTDAAFTIGVMKKYLDSTDDVAMRATWEYYAKEVRQSVPAPKLEQFRDTAVEMSKKNDKIASVDISRVLDASFVQNAAARGLAAP